MGENERYVNVEAAINIHGKVALDASEVDREAKRKHGNLRDGVVLALPGSGFSWVRSYFGQTSNTSA